MTAKMRDTEFEFMFGAINQHAHTDNFTTQLGHCCHDLAYGATSSGYVIDDENYFAGVNAKAPTESTIFSCLFGKNAAHT